MSLAGPIVNTGQYMSQINLSFPHCSLQSRGYILYLLQYFCDMLSVLRIIFFQGVKTYKENPMRIEIDNYLLFTHVHVPATHQKSFV